jgi:hypothetical protein
LFSTIPAVGSYARVILIVQQPDEIPVTAVCKGIQLSTNSTSWFEKGTTVIETL